MVIALSVLAWQARLSRREAGSKEIIRPKSVPAERLELLARFDPPAALERNGSLQLQRALEKYRVGDFPGAISGLQALLQTRPDEVAAHFYLGVSLLLSKNSSGGLEELRAVISAGSSPYRERAQYYLAKGLLGAGDVSGAEQQLQQVQSVHGDLERQAASLLQQMKP